MLGITVGWGGGTSTELAYMVVLDLAAKMPLAAGVKFTTATAGVTLSDVVAYSVCPHKPTDFFCLPAEVGCPTMLEWSAFQCLCQYFSDGLIWSHLISAGSLPEVYSRVVLGALRTRPETTLSKTWGFADDMVSWLHGCEITIVIYCTNTWHFEIYGQNKNSEPRAGQKTRQRRIHGTQVGSSWRIVFSSSTFAAWKAKEYELFFQATIYINRYTKSHSLIPNLYKDQKIDWSLIRFGL